MQQQTSGDYLKIKNIALINSEENQTPMQGPNYYRLEITKKAQKYNLNMPSWDAAFEFCMRKLS